MSSTVATEDVRNWIHSELWNQVPVAIGVIDDGYRVVEANPGFARFFGEWRARPCYAVFKDRTERCDRCGAAATFADGKARVREERGVRDDGSAITYLVQLVPLTLQDGTIPYVIEMCTDITATKVLEQEKLEAERLAAVGQTVAGLAHGIKNVIMGLEGGVYVVRSGMQRGDSDRILQGWEMVEENIDRISSFVKEFLDFARGRAPQVRLCSPDAVAQKVFDLFRDAARLGGVELTLTLGGTTTAMLDEDGVHTALANLVSNAVDACQVSERRGGHVKLSTRDERGALILEVEDDGVGMDAEIRRQVFTNFFSTKGLQKGTGLGLLTTRKIAQEHGGRVSFESTEGAGSVFRLVFPRDRLPKQSETGEALQEASHGAA